MNETYSVDLDPQRFLKEQLRLFAFDLTTPPTTEVLLRVRSELSKHERLTTLLEGELNFHGENSKYASHDLHAFAAKFPPQLPRAFIRGLTNPGDIVLDPMMGSGTSIVEALLEGRKGIGLDIDPLALRLCHVKTTPMNIDDLRSTGTEVITQATILMSQKELIENHRAMCFDANTKKFVDYWFLETTQRELAALVMAIHQVDNNSVRRFLELVFSSIIITKSGGVSRARDLAHSRPHLDETKIPRNAIEQFSIRLRKSLISIAQLKQNGANAAPIGGDARLIPLADGVIDLVVTSPPYANAIDYMRAHKFSLVWFGESVGDLSELRSKYIGSERILHTPYSAFPDSVENIIQQLKERDHHKATILRKYFLEMESVLAEIYRVLRPDSAAIIIVGSSTMRGLDIQTHKCLSDISKKLGFEVARIAQRHLDRNKRMMPARFGNKSDSMIEQRIHDEHVIGLWKD